MTHMTRVVMPFVVVVLALLAGCAEPPMDAINAAQQALANAERSDAANYAAEALRDASASVDAMNAELAAQEDKFALFRSYEKTQALAVTAKTAGEAAAAQAVEAKAKARADAESALEAARAAADMARMKLAEAPVGKDNQADIDAMKSDLAGVDSTISETEQLVRTEAYREAKIQADAAAATAQSITSMVEEAIAIKAASGKKR